ncbi:MAG TPA: ATP-binding protein, partial [Balneolaceae bacterium]|nr:ATP-binding protein [Balneolaceae bacterium]
KELRLNQNVTNAEKVKLSFSLKTLDYIMDTLFSNAVKYRGEKGAIIDLKYEINEGESLDIMIMDHGIGIREDELPKIATPFYRANDVINISGTGIGLSMVKDSLGAVGGSFVIESEYDEYTTVNISIPIEEIANDN